MNRCVIGLQWGDEGKGKVVDMLARDSDIVVRYSGGANAGHTVVIGQNRFALHLLPSGSVRPEGICVIGNGVVVDPECLLEEINTLEDKGLPLTGRLFISENAHVVLDYHKMEDRLREESLGKKKIGTTSRGIGPCYADKVGRSYALRMSDLLDLDDLREKLDTIIPYKNKLFKAVYNAEPINVDEVFEKCKLYSQKLRTYISDTTEFLHQAVSNGKSILFEGAQGTLLDLDHGTFPFVTSSNASALGMPAGTGLPAKVVDKFIGVAKAYTTRVGAGPFPTEQENEIGQFIRERGNEYGTTTGRPRRCGWFDAVAASYSAGTGGVDAVALMHLDTLAGLDKLKVCTEYEIDGEKKKKFGVNSPKLPQAKCVYQSTPGWDRDISAVSTFPDLPKQARDYVELIESHLSVPIEIISVGPEREQTIFR